MYLKLVIEIPALWVGSEFRGYAIRILLFFAGQRKRSKRKAALKLGLRLPSLSHLPSAVTKTRFAQTVCDLLPHATASLGCVLKGIKVRPFLGPKQGYALWAWILY